MECTVSWTGALGTRSGMGFVAETGSGHTFMMDGAPDAAKPENGGQNLAPRPMETVLAGTGGCTAYDVVLILKRGRHHVRRLQRQAHCRARRGGPQGVHRPSTCTSPCPAKAFPRCSGARHCHEPRKILLGQHHAGQDGGHHHQFRPG
jgi:uncharacterized OsmC-like protein